ncbi:hypothetical protein F5Y06DRAFT_293561 [Hypoxylon sp. FL0890]|nr:hypothetical protein F5Y06DRAFT_293561 [Hypoxylon sp. FL0890]
MALSQATSTPSGPIPTATSFLGPLPTTFSAPTTCGTSTYTWITGEDTTVWAMAPQTSDDPTCLPSNWVVNGYYSPGLCPYGYTNACSMTNNDVETTICCPTNQNFACHSTLAYGTFVCSFSVSSTIMTVAEFARQRDLSAAPIFQNLDRDSFFHTEIHFSTQIVVSDGTTISGADSSVSTTSVDGFTQISSSLDPASSTTMDEILGPGPVVLSSPLTITSRTTEFPGHALWAYSIQVQRAALTTSLPLDIRTTGSSITIISSQTGSGSPSTPPLSIGALSRTAIVGIAVGIIGALVLGAAGSYLIMRGRRGRNVPRSPRPRSVRKSVLRFSSSSLHELDEQRDPSEMPGWDERYSRGPNRPMAWELPAHRDDLEMSARDKRNTRGPNKPEAWELPA